MNTPEYPDTPQAGEPPAQPATQPPALPSPPQRNGSGGAVKAVVSFVALSLLLFVFAGGMLFQRFVVDPPSSGASAAENSGSGPETINQVWDLIQDQFVDQEAIDNDQMTSAAIEGMLETLHDEGHTRYLTAEESQAQSESLSGEYVGVGIQVEQRDEGIVVVAPIDGSPAMEAGIRPGDVLVSVDGKDVTGQSVDDVVKIIRGPEGTDVSLEFRREGQDATVKVVLTRRKIEVSSVSWVMLDNNTALIRLSQFSSGAGDDVIKALGEAKEQGAASVILDLRNNPGGYVNEAVKVASTFVPEGSTIFISQFRDGSSEEHTADAQEQNIGDLPLIVLVNEGSASSSEIVSGAIQANTPNATIIGERTFGTGTVLSSFNLDNGGRVLLGTELWLTPDGRMIRDHGVRPDVIVGLRDGQFPFVPVTNSGPPPSDLNDFQLEWAINVLQNVNATAPQP